MRNTLIMTTIALAAGSTLAGVTPTFLATNGDQLYRYDGGGVDTFTMADRIIGMTVDASGNVVGSSPSTAGNVGLYNLNNPFGTPSLSFVSATAGNSYTSLTYVDGDLYGFFDGSQRIYNVDTGTDLGPIGVNNTTFGGSAYDADNGVFYALGRNTMDDSVSLYTVSGFGGGSLSSTLVGSIGVLGDGMSLEFYDGTLYAAIQNIDNGHFELGSLDLGNGSFNFMQTLATSFSPEGDPTSLAIVVPAPASMALLGMGGLMASRRRR
ncbi:MAG: PEP-CTERM sorting domain-containing protein [Phycisphaerales bacterium JB052]